GARADDQDLPSFSLEQLSDVVVTSVSRQEERLANAAASIYIISASDISRAGVRTLPEALRLAPNLQVARVDARNYAVTARGFNSAFQNKLLVLIDGRSVYSPLFSGVFWDAQDVLLSDIERIEVISGPGATIYGANAVNGVINIITRSSKDSQGGLVAGIGGEGENTAGFRYGTQVANGHVRAYVKAIEVDDTFNERGADTNTGFARQQAGFRADWDVQGYGLRLSGDAYQGKLGQTGTADIRIGGANLNSSIDARLGEGSDLHIALILDHTERNQPNAFVERLDTIDLSAQHNVRLGERHRVSWGGGYRSSRDHVVNGAAFGFLPGELDMHWGNVFAQDEISLTPALKATLGLKLEHNNYTGLEHLPNVRLAWSPGSSHLVWGSLARSVRAPSRIDRDLYSPTRPAVVDGIPRFAIAGGPDFGSEVVKVAEVGYRSQATQSFSYSVTAFHGDYDKLRTLEPRPVGGSVFQNLGQGTGRGIEAWWRWQPAERWRLSGGVVAQRVKTSLKSESRDASGATGLANNDARQQWFLRSYFDVSTAHQVDLMMRYNSGLPNPSVPAYAELDAQWTWKLGQNWEAALIGKNLLHSSHVEFGGAGGRSVFERTALLKLVNRF
ncbi:MAG: TonB-dependent receptor plug domain-containing protein, partial [Telluria sp.]